MRAFTALALATTLLSLAAPAASAGVALAGFEAYQTDSTGAAVAVGSYLFSSNTYAVAGSTASATVTPTTVGISPQTAETSPLAFGLVTGTNDFTITTGYSTLSPSGYLGIGLVFTSNGTSFNPNNVSTSPELSAFVAIGASSPAPMVPSAGTSVYDYGYPYNHTPGVAYSGAQTYAVGGDIVSITALTASGSSGTGTFEVTVTPSPEPASLLIWGLIIAGGLVIAGRRRKA